MEVKETDAELQARYQAVKDKYTEEHRKLDKLRLDSPIRGKRARHCGSLYFLILGMESELRDRGLMS